MSDRPSPRLLLLAGLCLGAAALTKEEGLLGALVVLAATPLLAVRRVPGAGSAPRALWWRPLVGAIPIFTLSILPWLLLRSHYPMLEPSFPAGLGLGTLLGHLLIAAAGLGVRAIPRLLAVFALGPPFEEYAD